MGLSDASRPPRIDAIAWHDRRDKARGPSRCEIDHARRRLEQPSDTQAGGTNRHVRHAAILSKGLAMWWHVQNRRKCAIHCQDAAESAHWDLAQCGRK